MMTLTHEHVQQLTAPFPANEHEWFNGLAYVDELAVCTRLDSVDPSWEYTRVGEPVYGDNRVTIFMRMTVCGVTREDAGTSKLSGKKRDGGTFEVDEPEKNALTDALRRCARRFGIGRYLTILPNTVKDERALEDWINRYLGMPQKQAPQGHQDAPAQPKHSTPAKAQKQASTGELDVLLKDGGWTMFYPMAYAMYDNPNHAKNSVSKMVKEGRIKPEDTVQQALEMVRSHLETNRAAVMENEGRSDMTPDGEKIFDGDF